MEIPKIFRLPLRAAHKVYTKLFVPPFVHRGGDRICDPIIANRLIYNLLVDDKPCMICRYGATELNTVTNFLGVENNKCFIRYITDKQYYGWWDQENINNILELSGFFPNTLENIEKFSHMMCEDSSIIDLLGSWLPKEKYMEKYLPKRISKVMLMYLEPWWGEKPWSKALEGKKVLVVHPFANQIKSQYENHRMELFENPDVLPEFKLETIPAVQSLGGEENGFTSWFEALKWMENEIDKREYDVCLMGCGAYGFPLAAHVKRQGKKAVHLGGALQLLFGIKGKRWEEPTYGDIWGVPNCAYQNLVSKPGWVRPGEEGRPSNAQRVEGACYW